MEYTKPLKTYEEQAEILIDQRDMVVDRSSLVEYLQDAGYYRLSGCWRTFKQPDDTFREGAAFAKVWDLYMFDRQFRLVVFDAIERVEVYFRIRLAYELARTTGPFGFNDRNNLPNLGGYERFIRKCKEAFNRVARALRHPLQGQVR